MIVVPGVASKYRHTPFVRHWVTHNQYYVLNPPTAKLFNLNFHSLEVVSR